MLKNTEKIGLSIKIFIAASHKEGVHTLFILVLTLLRDILFFSILITLFIAIKKGIVLRKEIKKKREQLKRQAQQLIQTNSPMDRTVNKKERGDQFK